MAQIVAGQLWVGTLAQVVYVRLEGRGTHLCAHPVREFGAEMVRRGYRDFSFDLGCCSYMDSTFLGVLAGLSMRLEHEGTGRVTLFKTCARNLEVIKTLGLDRLFTFAPEGALPSAPATGDQRKLAALFSKDEWSKTLIDAHQLLIRADESNRPRFTEVIRGIEEERKLGPSKRDPTREFKQ